MHRHIQALLSDVRWRHLAFAVVVLCLPLTVLAQAVDGGLVLGAPPLVIPGVDDDTMQLVQRILALLGTLKSGSLVLTLAGAVKLLVDLTKVPAIDRWIGQVPWGRPLASLVLGFLLVFLGALASGAGILPALGAGAVAGLAGGAAGNGLNELWNAFMKPQKAVERDVGAAVVEAIKDPVKQGDAAVVAKLDATIAHLEELKEKVKAGAPEAERLAHLAELSNLNPPKAAS